MNELTQIGTQINRIRRGVYRKYGLDDLRKKIIISGFKNWCRNYIIRLRSFI